MKRRVERAAVFLKQMVPKQDSLTLVQVAHQFGFADQSHFTRVFKQIKGTTPKQFLKRS